ncbi:gibberellin-regulated protein 2-like [Cornus florida]|uniref:gibberellin-regulated protein 2-like n=1 Tax=Cornus florida TaxID=4283 RepID=UPI002897FBD9|nr:gibberellin-regulated protein 2-like [Cornus florida]
MAQKIALFLACVLLVATVATAWAEKNEKHIHVVTKASVSPAASAPTEGAKISGKKCVELCEDHCKSWRKKRGCVFSCTTCCNKLNCVPVGGRTCSNWTSVTKKGEQINCPKSPK